MLIVRKKFPSVNFFTLALLLMLWTNIRYASGQSPLPTQYVFRSVMDEFLRKRAYVLEQYARLRAEYTALPEVLRDFQVYCASEKNLTFVLDSFSNKYISVKPTLQWTKWQLPIHS